MTVGCQLLINPFEPKTSLKMAFAVRISKALNISSKMRNLARE